MFGGMERFSAGRGSGTRPSAVGGGMAGGGAAPAEPPSPAESDIRLILSEWDRFTGLFFPLERTIIQNYAFAMCNCMITSLCRLEARGSAFTHRLTAFNKFARPARAMTTCQIIVNSDELKHTCAGDTVHLPLFKHSRHFTIFTGNA